MKPIIETFLHITKFRLLCFYELFLSNYEDRLLDGNECEDWRSSQAQQESPAEQERDREERDGEDVGESVLLNV